jgi:phosphohistidine phosphatase
VDPKGTKLDLFILRHGDAGKRSAIVKNDSKRSLTDAGKIDLVEIAKALANLDIEFDYAFSSPLTRAQQSAAIILKTIKCKNKIENLDELLPEGNRMGLFKKLSNLKQDSSVLLVGHEPFLSELVSDAISNCECRIDLKKSGLARIRIISFNPKIRGELRWFLTPKLMKHISN